MIYYTSDHHFGHADVITCFDRPFYSVSEMHAALIENWNDIVTKNDTVYILGDMAFLPSFSMKPILKKLKGTKHLIIGNHDGSWLNKINPSDFFESVSAIATIDDEHRNKYHHVVLCHYPMLSWDGKEGGAIHIHGHLHNLKGEEYHALRQMNYKVDGEVIRMRAFNACVEVNDYKPVTLGQLLSNNAEYYQFL
jgi:calcineurin-like phosphoesterase family protein